MGRSRLGPSHGALNRPTRGWAHGLRRGTDLVAADTLSPAPCRYHSRWAAERARPCGRAVRSHVPKGRPQNWRCRTRLRIDQGGEIGGEWSGSAMTGVAQRLVAATVVVFERRYFARKRRRGGACAGSRLDPGAGRSGHDREPPLQCPTDVMWPMAVRQVPFRNVSATGTPIKTSSM